MNERIRTQLHAIIAETRSHCLELLSASDSGGVDLQYNPSQTFTITRQGKNIVVEHEESWKAVGYTYRDRERLVFSAKRVTKSGSISRDGDPNVVMHATESGSFISFESNPGTLVTILNQIATSKRTK